MKLDYDLIRRILEKIESDAVPGTPLPSSALASLAEGAGQSAQVTVDYHLQILHDDGLVVVMTMGPGQRYSVPGLIMINRLSSEGHRVLDAMRNDTIWSKIKGAATTLGKEGLKQIPGLAIKLLLQG